MRVVITDAAWDDMYHIGRWIKDDNPSRALTFLLELEDRCKRLADMPRSFPLVPRYEQSGVRRRPHGNYSIFYRIGVDEVEVLHVLNGAQDFEAILFGEAG